MRQIRSRFTYANVMSTIAVVLALGGATAVAAGGLARNSVGTQQLKKNAVTGVKVKDGSLSGADVNVSRLGVVPSASTATTAQKAAVAERAGSAERADVASTAAGLLPPEAPRLVGAPGEPPFEAGWQAVPNLTPPAFYMDREGIVHMQGFLQRVAGGSITMFTLPPGYAPAREQFFLTFNGALTPAVVLVESDGAVRATGGSVNLVSVNGITWRAGN